MLTRLAAAAVGLAILLPLVVFGGQLAADLVVLGAALVCVAEYGAMACADDRVASTAWVGSGFGVVYGAVLVAPAYAPLAAGLVTVATLIYVTLRPGDALDRAADRAARLVLGVHWIGLLVFLPLLRREESGLAWIFMVLAVSWLGDTGGYFAGKYFGRHKLYPRISPKKTWEGVAGGITFSVVGALIVRSLGLPHLDVATTALGGAVLCAAGILGDLSESMLKRAFDVKDSGSIMPGHGGLLDRIDSVIFVGPLAYAWALAT